MSDLLDIFYNKSSEDEEDSLVTVHFVPHSHMDAGWLKTYDNYFSAEVKVIFKSVFAQLKTDEQYTYTLGDIAFFKRYWQDVANQEERDQIKKFVQNGQLEFVHGGMVSTDEATTNYADIIRNFEAGHDFLKSEFGIKPKVGWQLDPFGHSAANAELMAQMGLEAVFMARINEQDFAQRKQSQDLQFVWKPEFSLADDDSSKASSHSEIFGHVLFTSYSPPKDTWLNKAYYTQGMSMSEKTAEGQAHRWISHFEEQEAAYRTNNLLILWGDDFAHRMADKTYGALDMIMLKIREHMDKTPELKNTYRLKYSSIDTYLRSVHKDAKDLKIDWQVETGDFWRYNYRSDPNAFWTGYFTTQPDFKRRATAYGDFAQSAQLITALSPNDRVNDLQGFISEQDKRFETLSVMQHHDAMTGTHPYNVGLDYLKMMERSENETLQTKKGEGGILAKEI